MYTMIPAHRDPAFSNNFPRPMMNDMFTDRFFRSFFNMNDTMGPASFRVDIRDEGDRYLLSADLPGIPRDQISVTVRDSVLTISADTVTETKEEKDSFVCSERRRGHMERKFNLDGIQEDAITATSKDGVLTLTLPRVAPAPEPETRTIEIS